MNKHNKTDFVKEYFQNPDTTKNIAVINGEKYTTLPNDVTLNNHRDDSLKEALIEKGLYFPQIYHNGPLDHGIGFATDRWYQFAEHQNKVYYPGGHIGFSGDNHPGHDSPDMFRIIVPLGEAKKLEKSN